jgi:hypothetical protein
MFLRLDTFRIPSEFRVKRYPHKLRTDAAKRFKKVENALAVIWKMMRSPRGGSPG